VDQWRSRFDEGTWSWASLDRYTGGRITVIAAQGFTSNLVQGAAERKHGYGTSLVDSYDASNHGISP
jgi:hypothetical protein